MQTNLFSEPEFKMNGALFSECRKYRYALWRSWDMSKPGIMFIGLNPSTANEDTNDPTIRRVINFAKDWGYGKVTMANLFALVSPYPKDLKSCEDPIQKNDEYLKSFASACDDVIFAWGNFDVLGRDKEVIDMFPNALCLGKNKNGSPKHPLYIPSNILPYIFKPYDMF